MVFGNKPPYTTMQQLNLDWILSKLKTLLRLVPDNGAVGQILRRTRDGAEWSDETGGGGAVSSVNGQTGEVVLDAADVGALPDSYQAPVTSVNGETGEVTIDLGVTGIVGYRDVVGEVILKGLISMVGYSGVRIDSPSGNTIRFECTKSTIGLGNVDNVRQYSASNPPPYPVRSVNGQTGAVVINIPVTSVNGQTGAVVLDAADVGLDNVDNVQQYSASNPPPYPVTSVNGQTGAVVIPTGGDIESGTNYCKLPDGTLMQWGTVSITAGATANGSADWTFPVEFIDTDYVVQTTAATGSVVNTRSMTMASGRNTDSVTIYWRNSSNSSYTMKVGCFAIGRWKGVE